jgi:erythromycin esterase-like protein
MATSDLDGLDRFLDSRPGPVDLLAVGEPTHGEPAFLRVRNAIVTRLVARGFRAVAIESDRAAALAVDAYVQGGDHLDPAGFTPGFGELAGNRDLVEWMRAYNRTAPEDGRLRFHGFDAPIEMTHALSPVPYLRVLRDHLHRADDLVDDERWSDPRAQLDAARSIGRSPAAVRLRVTADDLLTALFAEAPTREADWYRAYVNGVTALGLLRYHAVAADPAPPHVRASRMLAVRDALMARNLLDIRRHTDGPVLVAAHNRHLQRYPSRWNLAGMDLEWHSAGAIVSTLLKHRYAVVAGSLGSSAALGLEPPAPGTFEGRLNARTGEGPLFTPDAGKPGAAETGAATRTDVTPEQGYFPLDADTVATSDAIWHVDLFCAEAAALADRISRLPGVEHQRAGPGTNAPELGWDDRFFFVGGGRRHPFATIVGHDIPGFDEESRLDRAGVYRLNLDLGRDEFRRLFGYGPEEFRARRDGIDFAGFDAFVPHPVYATQSWASVVNPGERSAEQVERLLAHAHRRHRSRGGG